jgi:DNA-binding MarR family transcriptional regulator/ribosomal protein S18 acetylase RimI-like enzyme
MSVSSSQVALARSFNRDYTRRIGLLQRALHDSPYSLTEARVIYEVAHRREVSAAQLAEQLDLDPGYVSRIVKRLMADKLLTQRPAPDDARRRHLQLTLAGRQCFAQLDRKSELQVARMLSKLDESSLQAVLTGMRAILEAFNPRSCASETVLRLHRPGDMGWVVARHGELYFQEYGWDQRFEALVAKVVSDFAHSFDPKRERCWIAERDGQRVGSVFLVAKSRTTAKLRMLLVEPAARGCGLGGRLVQECIEFARPAGYRRIELWTQKSLSAARRLYLKAGFKKIAEEAHDLFGPRVIGETWSLDLRAATPA